MRGWSPSISRYLRGCKVVTLASTYARATTSHSCSYYSYWCPATGARQRRPSRMQCSNFAAQPFATTTTVDDYGDGVAAWFANTPKDLEGQGPLRHYEGTVSGGCWLKSRIHVVNLFHVSINKYMRTVYFKYNSSYENILQGGITLLATF